MAVIEKGEIRERGSRLCFCCMGTARSICLFEQIDGSDRMTDKELRKLNRTELLQMLLEQSRETERLRELLEQAEEKLRCREIELQEAGNIAQASLQVNGVFDSAQKAAEEYLENVRQLSGRQKEICTQMEEESRERAGKMIEDAQRQCREMIAAAQAECEQKVRDAEQQAQAYWKEVTAKMELVAQQYEILRKSTVWQK